MNMNSLNLIRPQSKTAAHRNWLVVTIFAAAVVLLLVPSAQSQDSTKTSMSAEESRIAQSVYDKLLQDPKNRSGGEGPGEGWMQMPGKKTAIRFGGFVQANYIHDFQNTGYPFGDFIPSLIPVPTEKTPGTQFDPRTSRVTFETQTPTQRGRVSTFISMDFAGNAEISSIQPRLRQAYVSWTSSGNGGSIIFGQSWTTFIDLGVWPEIFDLEGPNAMTGLRQTLVRYSFSMGESKHWVAGVALEQPETQVRNGIGLTEFPDAAAKVNWSGGWGHLEAAGVARQLVAESTSRTGRDDAFGWGLSLSGNLKVPGTKRTTPKDRLGNLGPRQDNLKFQVVGGSGVGRYVFDFGSAPEPQDAVYDTTASVVTPLEAVGAFGAYQHWWGDMWRSTLVGGYLEKTKLENLPPGEFKDSIYAVLNLVYRPFNRMDICIEYYWGQRTNKDGQSGHANRLLVGVNYVL